MTQISNGEIGISVREKLNALFLDAETIVTKYRTRAEVVANAADIADYAIVIVGGLIWWKDGGSAIPDMPGFSPIAPLYPDHWRENTIPGTTDMSAAVQAALGYGPTRLKPVSYYCATPMEVFARNGAQLVGESQWLSKLVMGEGNHDWLLFYTRTFSGPTPQSVYGVQLRNLTIETNDNYKTSGYLVNFEQRAINCVFEDVIFRNGYNQIRATAMGFSYFTRCLFEGLSKSVAGAGGNMLHFYSDETVGRWDNTSPISLAAKPTDVHVTDCQFNTIGGQSFDKSVYIEAADGIYFTNCHIRGAENAVVFKAQTLPCRSVVASCSFDACYFDGVSGSHVVFEGVGNGTLWTAPGAGGVQSDVRYRGHRFSNCQFRAAGNGSGSSASLGSIRADMDSGYVDWVIFDGCNIRDNRRSGIYAPTNGEGLRYLTVSDCIFARNNDPDTATNGANAASHGDIWIANGGHTITGNQFIGGGANGNAVRIGGGSQRSLIAHNTMDQSNCTTKISRGDTSVSIRGNIGFTLRAIGQVVITSPATTAVVTHGLSLAPEAGSISLTMRSNPSPATGAWITAIGSTTFTINLSAAPTSPLTIDWQVNTERL